MNYLKLMASALALSALPGFAQFPADYTGTSYSGAPVNGTPLKIPGTINVSYYDDGGEGVAYHDTDPVNSGAKYGNFRPNEGVDVEVMQPGNRWADSSGKEIPPGQPYVGWCVSGEWLKYTISVDTAGEYEISGVMTSPDQVQRTFILDNKDTLGSFKAPPSGNTYHSWRVYTNLVRVHLPAGKHLLTVQVKSAGDMWKFTFRLVQATTAAPARKNTSTAVRPVRGADGSRLNILAAASPAVGKAGRLFDCRGRAVAMVRRCREGSPK